MKVKEVDKELFIASAMSELTELVEQVPDARAQIEKFYDEKGFSTSGISMPTALNRVKAMLKKRIVLASQTAVKGLIAGASSRKGRAGIQVAFLRPNGKHLALSTWDLKVGEGPDAKKLYYPSIAELAIVEDNYQGRDGKIVHAFRINDVVAIRDEPNPAEVMREKKMLVSIDDLLKVKPWSIVAFKMTISKVFAAKDWDNRVEGETAESLPLKDGNDFQFTLMGTPSPKNNQVRAVFNSAGDAKPLVMHGDLIEAVEYALRECEDYDDQAQSLGVDMDGRDVIIVGKLGSVREGKYADWDITVYPTAIMSADVDLPEMVKKTEHGATEFVEPPEPATVITFEPISDELKEEVRTALKYGANVWRGKVAKETKKNPIECLTEEMMKDIKSRLLPESAATVEQITEIWKREVAKG